MTSFWKTQGPRTHKNYKNNSLKKRMNNKVFFNTRMSECLKIQAVWSLHWTTNIYYFPLMFTKQTTNHFKKQLLVTNLLQWFLFLGRLLLINYSGCWDISGISSWCKLKNNSGTDVICLSLGENFLFSSNVPQQSNLLEWSPIPLAISSFKQRPCRPIYLLWCCCQKKTTVVSFPPLD